MDNHFGNIIFLPGDSNNIGELRLAFSSMPTVLLVTILPSGCVEGSRGDYELLGALNNMPTC